MKISINEKVSSMIIELKSIKNSSINDVVYSAIEEYYNKVKNLEKVHDDQNRTTRNLRLQ